MPGGFQTQVYNQPAQAVAGDFASANPYFTFDAGPGGLVAGAAGVTVGRFAWVTAPLDPNSACQIANNFGQGQPAGFVHRSLQGLNTVFLSDASMLIPQGLMVTLMTGGDFWVINSGTVAAVAPGANQPIPMKAYASLSNGAIAFNVTGTPPTGSSSTTSTIATQTTGAMANSAINGNVLSVPVGTVTTNPIVPGAILTGTGVATGTMVLSQVTPLLTGEVLGGGGRYLVTPGEQTVAATSITGTYGLLTAGTTTGAIALGAVVAGGTTSAGTVVTANASNGAGLTGTGGAGTYAVSPSQTVASATLTTATWIETKWFAMSGGLTGELVKISDHAIG
jgi:hypothetical protein